MRGAVQGDGGISIRLGVVGICLLVTRIRRGKSGGGRVNNNCSGLEGRVRQMLKCCIESHGNGRRQLLKFQ